MWKYFFLLVNMNFYDTLILFVNKVNDRTEYLLVYKIKVYEK